MSALLNETPAVTPRHGNQTFVNIAQMKRKPIASGSPLLQLKLIHNQVHKCSIKKDKQFVRKLQFSWLKKFFLSFAMREFITLKYVE